ncbi:hypothetical protein M3Y97_00865000 [Aphelenchoides bicaudatus]|nr:hypothetical protein M3Y97_00865000 [Aphelenchoides bicaudatus]
MTRRQYPAKKAKKINSKDPLERMSKDVIKKNRLNVAPTKDDLDSQPLTRKWIAIQEKAKEAKEASKRTRSGKKRAKNKFYELTAKMGFKKRPWENEAMLTRRVIREKNKELDEELMKVSIGTAGRSRKEIEADIKVLDEKERQKKLLKVAAAEKRRKLNEKEERFRQSQLAKYADENLENPGPANQERFDDLESADEY